MTNTCNKDVPDCCTSNAQCGKCETCDLVTNTCNKDVPDCCDSDEQCPMDTPCVDYFCDLETNACDSSTTPVAPEACCLPDTSCADLDPLCCLNEGGTPKGPGSVCAADVCLTGLGCRVTGGGVNKNEDWDGSFADGEMKHRNGTDRYTFGGQAGAPLASQPQPWGEWTHHQKNGPAGNFVFHAGTASAPEDTEIDVIECSDPGWCVQARPAPAKQIDFAGVGSFKNMRRPSESLRDVVPGETLHWFEVHIEDLGEPGRTGTQEDPPPECPPEGSAGELADCGCPDFYAITIHATTDPGSDVIYRVFGYILGGNLQIHPPTARDTGGDGIP